MESDIMYALRKHYHDDFFAVEPVRGEDVQVLLDEGCALFTCETHAKYAQSILGAAEPPTWKPDPGAHGSILSDEDPYFCPDHPELFTSEWMNLMTQECRLRVAQASKNRNAATELRFYLSSSTPAPGPWAIIHTRSTEEIFIVDRGGIVIGAMSHQRLDEMKGVTFANELERSPANHLDLVEAA